jgi:hypothetical protein
MNKCNIFYKEYIKLYKLLKKYQNMSYRLVRHNKNMSTHLANVQHIDHPIVAAYVRNSLLYTAEFSHAFLGSCRPYFYVYLSATATISDIDDILARLIFILLYFFERAKKMITVYWVPVSIARVFRYRDIEQIALSQQHFEAFTTSGVNFGDISVITRIEEAEKLLIHELIHNIRADMSSQIHTDWYKEYEQTKKNVGGIGGKMCLKKPRNYSPSPVLLIEIFTEWSCTLYYIVFFIFLDVRSVAPLLEREFDQMFEQLCNAQKKYSVDTVMRIMHLNGYRSVRDFNKWKFFFGEYPFFEYYYMKCMAMLYLQYSEDVGIYRKIISLCKRDFVPNPFAERYYTRLRSKFKKYKDINFKFINFTSPTYFTMFS